MALGEKLKQLMELYKLARPAMEEVFWALWPAEEIPSCRLREARARTGLWKASAAREGARQGWAMLQTHFPELDICPIVVVGPKGSDGKEIMPDGNFDRVMEYARISESDCHLDQFIE